jgi:hypothetical protein
MHHQVEQEPSQNHFSGQITPVADFEGGSFLPDENNQPVSIQIDNVEQDNQQFGNN